MPPAPQPASASWSKRVPATDGWYWFRCHELIGRQVLPARVEHRISCDIEAAINVEVGPWAGDYVDLPPGSRWWTRPICGEDESRWSRTPPTTSGLYLYRSDEDETWRPFTVAEVTCEVDEDGEPWTDVTIREHNPGGVELSGSLEDWPGEWFPVALEPPK